MTLLIKAPAEIDEIAARSFEQNPDHAAAAHIERENRIFLRGRVVGKSFRLSGLPNAAGALEHVGFQTAARNRAEHLAPLADQHPRAGQAIARALYVDDRH